MKILYSFILFHFFTAVEIFSQDTGNKIFHIDSLSAQGILFDKGWKFHAGDNPEWANPGYNDNDWQPINPILPLYRLPEIKQHTAYRFHPAIARTG